MEYAASRDRPAAGRTSAPIKKQTPRLGHLNAPHPASSKAQAAAVGSMNFALTILSRRTLNYIKLRCSSAHASSAFPKKAIVRITEK
jgi:hypothetical protein